MNDKVSDAIDDAGDAVLAAAYSIQELIGAGKHAATALADMEAALVKLRGLSKMLAAAPKGAAFGYVSVDGSLRLSPEHAMALGVPAGGGVVVMKREGQPYLEILSNEQFSALMAAASEDGK